MLGGGSLPLTRAGLRAAGWMAVLWSCWNVISPAGEAKPWTQSLEAGNKAYAAKEFAEAERQFQAALELCEKSAPKGPDAALILNRLGLVCLQQGKRERAAEFLRRSVEQEEERLGPEHPSLATVLVPLAQACEGLGQFSEAEASYRRAARLVQKGPSTLTARDLADIYLGQGRSCAGLQRFMEAKGCIERPW